MIHNALSIDVEEYYHGMEFEAAVPAYKRHRLPSRVERSTERVLELLNTFDVCATFFIVGEIAAAHPVIVRRIAAEGHEVACHSDSHELVRRQTPEQFRRDIQQAKTRLEDLSGQAVFGYRAPNYSIGREQAWAYDLLFEAGFLYDSSVYPIHHDRYGQASAPRFPYEIRGDGHTKLLEFPIGTIRLLGINLPIGGGGYFRLMSTAWIQRGIQYVNTHEGKPIMFYFHPWELDPHHPSPSMPWHHRFRHYINLERMESKLHQLLRHVPFAPACQVLGLLP